VSEAGGGPMQKASSASLTNFDWRSASLQCGGWELGDGRGEHGGRGGGNVIGWRMVW
jgi:hypothetical protein